MIQKVALFGASLAAALVIAGGLALAGMASGGGSPAGTQIEPVAATADTQPRPTVQVDTVYLAAPGKPADVTVTKTVMASAHGGDDGNEHEGAGDD